MFDYLTAEETAAKWRVSTQHVQALCRKGKVDGAIKKGNMWFIPDKATHPEGSDDPFLAFRGTKKRLFEKALKLFAERSYEAVTLKDIGDEAGISQSAIYRHFQSKQELLDVIYTYFCYYHINDRPSQEELDAVIEKGSLIDLLNACSYNYRKDHEELMISCLKVVFQRMSIDERAGEIIRKLILESGLEFTEQFFIKAMHAGKLPKDDAHALSMLCNMSRIYALIAWFAYPVEEKMSKVSLYEQKIKEIVIRGTINSRDQ